MKIFVFTMSYEYGADLVRAETWEDAKATLLKKHDGMSFLDEDLQEVVFDEDGFFAVH